MWGRWIWRCRLILRERLRWRCNAWGGRDTGGARVPRGRFFVTTRDDLMECAALVRAIKLGDLDRLIIPEAPLDVLAQQIVATCASGTSSAGAVLGTVRGQDGPATVGGDP